MRTIENLQLGMQGNQKLIAFLAKEAKKVPAEKRDAFSTVMESVKLCPLILNLDDSLDLIGVDDLVSTKLRQFFLKSDSYVPKTDSVAYKMLQVLHKSHPDGLSKSDILKGIGYKPPPVSGFRAKSTFYGSWASIKTLESHGLVERSSAKSPLFTLTEQGLKMANEMFGVSTTTHVPMGPSSSSIRLIVASSEVKCRLVIDVRDAMRRTQLEWSERDLPVGSVWFCRGDDVLDTVVQFSTNENNKDELFCRKISGSVFTRKILITRGQEKEKDCEMKIKNNFEYGISVVYLESEKDISIYISGLVECLEKGGKIVGKLDDLLEAHVKRAAQTVGDVWKEQLKLVPGCGPHLAANLAATYETPNALIQSLETAVDPEARLIADISRRWGRKPLKSTVSSMLQLFHPTHT